MELSTSNNSKWHLVAMRVHVFGDVLDAVAELKRCDATAMLHWLYFNKKKTTKWNTRIKIVWKINNYYQKKKRIVWWN